MVRRCIAAWLVVALELSMWPCPLFAQRGAPPVDYRLKVGDELYISVPQRSALSRRLTVEQDGNVTLPVIGKLPASGLTAAEFQVSLVRAIQDVYPSITEVNVTVENITARVIYITGMVQKPGKYEFVEAPNLWEAIREAGGPSAGAVTGHVRVIRDESRGGITEVIDLKSALEQGAVDRLPLLEGGETVIVPGEDEITMTSGINVIGEVTRPGIYRLEGRHDLMTAILLAGGPTRRAMLKDVRIIQPQEDGSRITELVDFGQYLKTGDAVSNPTLAPGFTINVPEQNAMAYQLKNNAFIPLTVLTSLLTIWYLAQRIQDNKSSN